MPSARTLYNTSTCTLLYANHPRLYTTPGVNPKKFMHIFLHTVPCVTGTRRTPRSTQFFQPTCREPPHPAMPTRQYTEAERSRRNASRRKRYADNNDAINSQRRAKRRNNQCATVGDLLRSPVDDDCSNLQDILAHRRAALDADRHKLGITLEPADPCGHCGAILFAKEADGMCCKRGKFILPRLPPLPPLMQEMCDSAEQWAVDYRRNDRGYNSRSNFASLNVEDGGLQKYFGNHILSVQGR